MKTLPSIAFRLLLIGALWLPVAGAMGQRRAMGLKIDDAKYLRVPRKSPNIVFKGALPPAFSIRGLLPAIGDQGDDGTCVGWSAAYYMRTAMEAGKLGLGNQPAKIAPMAFSPGWLYGQIKLGPEAGCAEGVFLEDALEVMKTKGSAFLSCAPANCNVDSDHCDDKAANFKIGDYMTLFNPNEAGSSAEYRVAAIKSALAEGRNAVLIGMLIPESFIGETKENWQPATAENPENTIGAHAMAVVGYDDAVNGGSFLIANSWGKGWGKDGYVWVRYADLIRFTKNAYQIFAEPLVKPQPQTITLKGNVDFMAGNASMAVGSTAFRGKPAPGERTDIVAYTMTQPYASGTRFKMVVHNSQQSYVYILASDRENRVSGLFPYHTDDLTTSAVVPANSDVLMPSPDASFTLDDVAGEDYFIVFISRNELNLEELARKIKNTAGSITQKAYGALGEEFIPAKEIAYAPGKVSYEVKGNPKGSVVPIIVKIVHQ
ncbi:hypothetical protein GCM10010967_54420 [Dyadobacter beijingensis]|uniref:Peptidase C1A papain C-terminal domain-containing protein n=1 Tax=Dyadobacter beijingensis TaxID=365489 RepID=A0ABQ2III6_9BACT|nr:DUF4384 domain-containing protein [Dyadobacter beijingensis]GGN11595.1 hypothetical protein GCM10010967_54420 [Dyadobacter beijingensis]